MSNRTVTLSLSGAEFATPRKEGRTVASVKGRPRILICSANGRSIARAVGTTRFTFTSSVKGGRVLARHDADTMLA
jgi:hypothetical protein